jgi:acyl dehydratase
MRIFSGVPELLTAAGEELGASDWILVDQARINAFADATEDHQWIHVDPARAAAGPFGTTIAHGLLTISLMPAFLSQIYRVDNVRMVINYGLNKVRLPAPVPVDSRLRAVSRLSDVTAVDGGAQLTLTSVVEIEGGTKPACVAESLLRYMS